MEMRTNNPALAEQLTDAAKRVGSRYVSVGSGEVFIDKLTGKKLIATHDATFVRWDYSSRWVEGIDGSGKKFSVRSLDVVKLEENNDA